MATYTPTIGIEVHAELSTLSKMFCGCANDPHTSEPNTNICPVCLAHPGTLPAVNKEAVLKVLLVGQALGGQIADYSEFDRKQYFYPDIPKAYQLSQYAFPFVKGGELADVSITRVHLEEDTARSQHEGEGSIVDFNRAGVPLMELVTEPVIHDAKSAANFAKELQLLLQTIGVSKANMEKGEMRVEANISVSDSEKLGTKVEVKNLNSFKAVEQAILYEVKRQTDLLERGEKVPSETRGWDSVKSKTFAQRSKETAQDYRYFPDPDIPKYKISELHESRLDDNSVELPSKIRTDLLNIGLTSDQVETLVFDKKLLTFFRSFLFSLNEDKSDTELIKLGANYLISDITGLLVANNDLSLDSADAMRFGKLISMVKQGEITSRVAKDLLLETVFESADPEKIAQEKGLLQDNSEDSLAAVVDKIILDNPAIAEEYRGGKEAVLQYLVGQGMKATRGAANPGTLAKLLKEKLSV